MERCLACEAVVSKGHRHIAAESGCALQFCDRLDPVERCAGRSGLESTSQIRALQRVPKGSATVTVIALLATASQARQRSMGGDPSCPFARSNLQQESGRFCVRKAEVRA
jgi:hypothetical protein